MYTIRHKAQLVNQTARNLNTINRNSVVIINGHCPACVLNNCSDIRQLGVCTDSIVCAINHQIVAFAIAYNTADSRIQANIAFRICVQCT